MALLGLTIDKNNKQLMSFVDMNNVAQSGFGKSNKDKVDFICEPNTGLDETPNVRRIKQDIMNALKSLLDRITRGESLNVQGNMLQGTYRRLVDTSSFPDLIYPGLDTKSIPAIPRNVYELLRPGGAVRAEIVSRLPGICDSAYSILEGVRRRGAQRGDEMDRMTEAVLIPQISGESFSLAVVDVVKTLNWRASAVYAEHCLAIASPEDDRAMRDLLDMDVLRSLFDGDGVDYQDEFLSSEWANLVRDDLNRYKLNEKMSEVTTALSPITENNGASNADPPISLAWIEYDLVKDGYPALAEAVSCMHALPFEVNGKECSISAILSKLVKNELNVILQSS